MPGLVGSTPSLEDHGEVENPPPKHVRATGDNFLTMARDSDTSYVFNL